VNPEPQTLNSESWILHLATAVQNWSEASGAMRATAATRSASEGPAASSTLPP